MEIYPFDKTMKDVFTDTDLSGIQADGISIRSGNKIIRLQVTEEVVVDDTDAIKKDLEAKFAQKYQGLEVEFDKYKEQMKYSLREEKNKLDRKQQQLDRQLNETQTMPIITTKHMYDGLSVATSERGGLVWSFKTVYAPKFVGSRKIDPTFAKRLVTPISIELSTNSDGKGNRLIVRQILGNKKFHHYHSMSQSSDCWGNFTFDGKKFNSPEDVIDFLKEASLVLETINNMSIGTNNPRGLSRLATLEKHLLKADDVDDSKVATNPRNARAGVDLDRQEAEATAVWST